MNTFCKNTGIVLSSADFLGFKVSHLAPFSEVWIDVLLFHSVLFVLFVHQVCLTFHSVVVKELYNSWLTFLAKT